MLSVMMTSPLTSCHDILPRCEECLAGYFELTANSLLGCTDCDCDLGGSQVSRHYDEDDNVDNDHNDDYDDDDEFSNCPDFPDCYDSPRKDQLMDNSFYSRGYL